MKKLLNTLFISTQGAYLSKDGETVLVEVAKECKGRFPVHNLGGIICFGNVLCSPFLLGHCAENGCAVSMLTENGRFLARVSGAVSGNVLLRREQYRRADSESASAEIARSVTFAKIANSRGVLQRALRDRPDCNGARLTEAVNHLGNALQRVRDVDRLDAVRGVEGDAGRAYFGVFDALITNDSGHFTFNGRTRRPPRDPVNAVLSFVYTLLVHDVTSALESVGLDPQVGFMHRDRPGREGLALDLMEEFRPVLGDRLALSLINRGQLKHNDFDFQAGGAVMLNDDGRKTVLKAYQERKREEVTHRFLNEKLAIGLLPYVQALLFARFLRGDLDGYPPLILK